MEGLKPGRIVYYVFSEQAADEVNRRRTSGASIAERMEPPDIFDHVTKERWPVGAMAHIGNPVLDGDILPAMVVRVHPDDTVNLKVMLDGTDVYWARNVAMSGQLAPGSWHWMFEGQSTRYDASKQQ